MKRIVIRIGLSLLALAAGWFVIGTGESVMKTTLFAADRPLIDRVVPAKVETATFALG